MVACINFPHEKRTPNRLEDSPGAAAIDLSKIHDITTRSLHPASGNDRRSFLGALELVACGRMQLAQVVGAVVGHRVALEPSSQIFDRIEVGRVGWQVRNLDVTAQRVEIVAYEVAVVCPGSIPDHQQRLHEMGFECLEKLDKLFFLDAAFVKSEQKVCARQACNDRDVIPVEVKLDGGSLSLGGPGAHTGRSFADARFVDEDDPSAVAVGFFLRAGQVLRFQLRTTFSLRSMARLLGFCGLKPNEPKMRQICVWPNLTPCNRLITTPTRL